MKPTRKVLNGHPAIKVAIVQTAPVFLDREATVAKACAKIEEAAGQGAQVIVFSEAWVSGYPYWGEGWESNVGHWMDVRARFYDSTVMVDSEDTERLRAAAARANAVVVIGCNEMDERPSVHTIYNTLLFVDNHGRVIGRRRKIMPTFVERAVWGCGDGSDLQVVETDYGRIGALICGENLMTLARAHLIGQGEDLHVAVFPGAFALHTGPKLEEFDPTAESFWGYSSCRAHAFEAGAFVLASCGYITGADIPKDFALRGSLNIDYAQGGSAVYAPIGIPLAAPVPGDRIVYSDCPAQFVKIAKAVIDTVGHYARPDLFTLGFHGRAAEGAERARARRAVEALPRGELARIADRHEVEARQIEEAVSGLA
jgi:predicted amidohydrolase